MDVYHGEQNTLYSFRPMTPLEAGTWGARLRARTAYLQATLKKLELIEAVPIEARSKEQDEHFFALVDKKATATMEIAKVAMDLSDFSTQPGPEEFRKMVASPSESVSTTAYEVLIKFIESLVPTEEERKK